MLEQCDFCSLFILSDIIVLGELDKLIMRPKIVEVAYSNFSLKDNIFFLNFVHNSLYYCIYRLLIIIDISLYSM